MKLIIDNEIRIQGADVAEAREIKSWLTIANPVWVQNEKMGFSNYKTPRNLYFYKEDGPELIVPTGLSNRLMNEFVLEYKDNRTLGEKLEFGSKIELYDYQEEVVSRCIEKSIYEDVTCDYLSGVIVMPAGSGKTQTALELISRLGFRTLWLTHTNDLLNQSYQRAKENLKSAGLGKIAAGKIQIGEHITFATVQTMSKLDLSEYKNKFDLVISDECMPGDTKILTPFGERNLNSLSIGDIITSYSREKGLENKKITHIFKNKSKKLYEIKTKYGSFCCTAEHPIYISEEKYINAEDLMEGKYVLYSLPERNKKRGCAENKLVQRVKDWKNKLQPRVFKKSVKRNDEQILGERERAKTKRNTFTKNERAKQNGTFFREKEKNDYGQSDEKSRNEKKSFTDFERNKTSTKNKRWEWGRIDSSTKNTSGALERRVRNDIAARICDTYKKSKKHWLPKLLQGGFSYNRFNVSNRDRWFFALRPKKTRTGCEKGRVFEWVRVESVKIHEQTSDGTVGGMCRDGFVYNIEVEDNNNYFANGVLVHNCHRISGTPMQLGMFYKVISSLSAKYKIGLTATPYRAAKGTEIAMFSLLGDVIMEVDKSVVNTIKADIIRINTKWQMGLDSFFSDGTVNYSGMLTEMSESESRLSEICKLICENSDRTILVLSDRLELLRRIKDVLGEGVMIDGSMVSKKAKAERERAIEDMRTGKERILYASYSLAKEGLDIPRLDCLILATPKKDKATVIQSVGRIERVFEGKKKPIVYDLVDDERLHQSMFTVRKRIYKFNGNEIID